MENANGMVSFEERHYEHRFEEIVGNSTALKRALGAVARVAPTDATVLVLGETGTGKELIAQAIHKRSSRCTHPFVTVNCAAIPYDLLESELFGYEKGAFTGAYAQKIGRFEMADTGTLFLDEIGDIPLALQPKLLRVLQEKEFERLGSGKTHRTDVRLVAATHHNLTEMVARDQFRSDLYYRLNVFPVMVPPLRERREDIALLVSHFVEVFSRRMEKRISSIPKDILDLVHSLLLAGKCARASEPDRKGGDRLGERNACQSFPALNANSPDSEPVNKDPVALTFAQPGTFREAQRAMILRALHASGWVVGGCRGAAARLGLKRTTLISKMKKLGISRPAWQTEANAVNVNFDIEPSWQSAVQ